HGWRARDTGAHRFFDGVIENRSDRSYDEAHFSMRFFNKNEDVICIESLSLKNFPSNEIRSFTCLISHSETASWASMELSFQRGVGTNSDGTRFGVLDNELVA